MQFCCAWPDAICDIVIVKQIAATGMWVSLQALGNDSELVGPTSYCYLVLCVVRRCSWFLLWSWACRITSDVDDGDDGFGWVFKWLAQPRFVTVASSAGVTC